MITASASIIKVPPGYYPHLTAVLEQLIRPCGKTGRKSRRKPLLMTPKAIRKRAYDAAYKRRMRAGLS